MSDTITTTSSRMMRSDVTVGVPVGTRIRVVTLEGSSVLQNYVGEIGTIVSHDPGRPPLVKFETYRSGDNNWYVTAWNVLPAEGQRVTITECLDGAQENFKNWAIRREVTYLSTASDGHHLVRFDSVPTWDDFPNPANVEHIDFVLGAEVSQSPVETTTAHLSEPSIEVRNATANAKYDTLVEVLSETADEEDMCGEFEVWCEQVGIESRRTRDVEYVVDIDLEYEIADHTIGRILEREFGGDHGNVESSVTVTSSVTIQMTCSGGDSPHDVDSSDVRDALENAGYSGWDDWSITDYTQS